MMVRLTVRIDLIGVIGYDGQRYEAGDGAVMSYDDAGATGTGCSAMTIMVYQDS